MGAAIRGQYLEARRAAATALGTDPSRVTTATVSQTAASAGAASGRGTAAIAIMRAAKRRVSNCLLMPEDIAVDTMICAGASPCYRPHPAASTLLELRCHRRTDAAGK